MKPFTSCVALLVLAICRAAVAEPAYPDQRYLEAYTGVLCSGPFQEFFDSAPDLSEYSIDNAIVSARTTGIWILYSDTDFQGTLIDVFVGINDCLDEPLLLNSEASSLRYAGSPYGINDVYYTLYESTSWAGTEVKGNTDIRFLDVNVSSLIITGQSPWTFYTGPNFSGVAVCVEPTSHIGDDYSDVEFDYTIIESIEELGLPLNSIKSVARGCIEIN